MAEEIVSKTIQSGFKSQGEHQTSIELHSFRFDFEKMIAYRIEQPPLPLPDITLEQAMRVQYDVYAPKFNLMRLNNIIYKSVKYEPLRAPGTLRDSWTYMFKDDSKNRELSEVYITWAFEKEVL